MVQREVREHRAVCAQSGPSAGRRTDRADRQEAIDAVTASNTQPEPDRDLALRLLATVYDHPQFSEALRGALC
jgi:hypothetical protein